MIPGIGSKSISIGSGPNCDIRVGGAGVAPEHARITHDGQGHLSFVDLGLGPSAMNGSPIAPQSQHPFDFSAQFIVGHAPVPNTHPAIIAMLMQVGRLPPKPGQLVIGRDPERVHLAIFHPNVSGVHATLNLEPLSITDVGSTAGTFVGSSRIAPSQPAMLDPHGVVTLGPLPILVSTLLQFTRAQGQANVPVQGAGPAAVASAAAGSPDPGRKKHKTVIGQVNFGAPGQVSVKSIGRTPDNDIQITHAQVSSRHALLHRIGDQLLLEDRGSANGTYVRGQRIAPGQ
ncbi:MAG: FHA domain-containing protein, partial [Myxococcales bacterium]